MIESSATVPFAVRNSEKTSGATLVPVTVAAALMGVIAALDAQYPGLRFNLCHETGELRPFVNIFLEGESVRFLQGLDTPLMGGATVHIIHSVAGG